MASSSETSRKPYGNYPVRIKCRNEFCDTLVDTWANNISRGVYCEPCRKEARRLYDKESYDRNLERSRARKRVNSKTYYAKKNNGTS